MFDSGAAVRDFCEVVEPELFLLLETKRAMIG
jgi:hypothetical protein